MRFCTTKSRRFLLSAGRRLVLQDRAAFTVCLEGTAWCSITPSVSHIRTNITLTAHCVGRTFFGRAEPGCFHSFDWRFKFDSYERAQVSTIPIQQGLCDCIAVPLLHLGNFIEFSLRPCGLMAHTIFLLVVSINRDDLLKRTYIVVRKALNRKKIKGTGTPHILSRV